LDYFARSMQEDVRNLHKKVNHKLMNYMQGNVHVKKAVSFFALLKRGIQGTFHHVKRQHLDKYLKEFNIRWNARHITDKERFVKAIEGVGGKRLYYIGKSNLTKEVMHEKERSPSYAGENARRNRV
jgi:hypothetical protein